MRLTREESRSTAGAHSEARHRRLMMPQIEARRRCAASRPCANALPLPSIKHAVASRTATETLQKRLDSSKIIGCANLQTWTSQNLCMKRSLSLQKGLRRKAVTGIYVHTEKFNPHLKHSSRRAASPSSTTLTRRRASTKYGMRRGSRRAPPLPPLSSAWSFSKKG